MRRFLLRAVFAGLGLWLAERLVPGIYVSGFGALALAAILLGLVNALVRPVVILLTLPLTIVTLGLFLLVVNAAMLGLVSLLTPGFHVRGFTAALMGWIVVSVVSWIGSLVARRL